MLWNKKTNWENTIKYPPFYADDIGMDLFILYQSLGISSEYNDPYDRDKNWWDISYITSDIIERNIILDNMPDTQKQISPDIITLLGQARVSPL